jgi:hypothetical protein
MGARSVPHPAPGPGAAPGSIAAARRASGASDDPEPVAGPQVQIFGALEDVTDARPREKEPAGPNRLHRPHDEFAIQQSDRDRHAHPERVDRTGALEQQRLIEGQHRTSAKPTHPLSPGLGDHHGKGKTPRTEQSTHSHRATVPLRDDTRGWLSIGWWGGQDSNPRHEG